MFQCIANFCIFGTVLSIKIIIYIISLIKTGGHKNDDSELLMHFYRMISVTLGRWTFTGTRPVCHHRHHWAAVVSNGWANASECRLQVSLTCAALCQIMSLQYLSAWLVSLVVNKQSSNQASQQSIKQTSNQASNLACKQPSNQASKQSSKQAIRQASNLASKQSSKPAIKQASQQSIKQTSNQASNLACKQSSNKASNQSINQSI